MTAAGEDPGAGLSARREAAQLHQGPFSTAATNIITPAKNLVCRANLDEIRPHVGTALAADLADETMLYVGHAKVIGPLIGADGERVAAAIVRARLVQTASLFIAHLACRDCAP